VTSADNHAALDAALALGADGWFCFPCSKISVRRLHTVSKKRSANRIVCVNSGSNTRLLWSASQRAPPPGVDLLDIDCKHLQAREWWAANLNRLPQTRCHRTRSGGLHLLFRHAAGVHSTAGKIAPGVDTRGDGGYIIWWPAARLPVLKDVSPAPWPAWLLVQLQRSPEISRRRSPVIIPDDRALGRLIRLVAGAPEGQRNNLAFWAACRAGEMARSGLIALETATAVIAAAAMRAGLIRGEAERTARSGVLAGAGVANV
jgi:Bifunctional DNA primase/polymerase, N-terminal